MTGTARIDWHPVITQAAEIVTSYTTSVTLRQLFYRLVARQLLAADLDRLNEIAGNNP